MVSSDSSCSMSSTSCFVSATSGFYNGQPAPSRLGQNADGEPQAPADRIRLACGGAFRPMTLPAPISMSPMSDATLSVELGHVFVTGDVLKSGMGEESALAVDLGITNNGREPFTLSAGSMSCWMELSPNLPG